MFSVASPSEDLLDREKTTRQNNMFVITRDNGM